MSSNVQQFVPMKRIGTNNSPKISGDALADWVIDGDDNTVQDLALTCTKDWDEQSFTNLLENGDFESWSAGAAAAPDGWTYAQGGAGGDIARSTTEKIGTYSAEVTKSDSGDSYLLYELDDYDTFAGRNITLGVWIKSANTVADKVSLQVYDGVTASKIHYQNSGNWEFIEVPFTVDAALNYIKIYLIVNTAADAIVYYDGAILVEGSVCPAFSPKPLPNDGKTLSVDSINNRIGINDTSPSQALDIDGNIAVTGTVDAVDIAAHKHDGTADDGVKIDIAVLDEVDKQSFTNLLENGDFESWSAGTTVAPDGWVVTGAGATIAREGTTKKIGSYSFKLTAALNTLTYANLTTIPHSYNTTHSYGVWVYADTASRVRLQLSDQFSSYHTGGSIWEFLTVTKINSLLSVTDVILRMESGASISAYFDGAILVEGSVCPTFSLKPLSDDGHTLQIDSINNQVKADKFVEMTTDAGVDIEGVKLENYIAIEPPSSDTAITAAGGITVTRKIMRVAGNGGAIDITADPQIVAGEDGQIVIIQGTHDTNTVTLDDGTGLALSAQCVLAAQDNITLMYDSGDSEWIETSRCSVV